MCQGGDVWKVTVKPWKQTRKQRQRALANIWYLQIDQHLGEAAGYAEAFCKYNWGIVIRCRDDEELGHIVSQMLSGLVYDQCLGVIRRHREWFPVMRENGGLTVDEQAEYLSAIQINFAEQGLILSTPNDEDLLHCKEAQK